MSLEAIEQHIMGITSAITSSEPKSKPQRLHSTNQHSDGKYSIAWRWRRKATSPRWNSASRLNRRIVTATHRASRPRTPSHLPHPLERNILRLQHHNVAIPDRVLRLRLHRHPPNPNQRSPNPTSIQRLARDRILSCYRQHATRIWPSG